MNVYKSLWSELQVSKSLRRAFGMVFAFSMAANLLVLTSPIYMMQVFDRVLGTGKIETLFFLTLIALFCLMVLGLLEGVRSYLLTRLGRYLDAALRDPLLIQAIARSRIDGEDRRRLVDELGTVRNYMGSAAVLPFFDAPWVPLFLIVITIMHPWLGVLSLVAAIILFGLAIANDRLSRQPLREASALQNVASEFAGAAIQNADVVHAMGMQNAISARYRTQVDAAGIASQRAADLGAIITATSKAFRIAVQVGVLGLGAYLSTIGELSPGGMIAASIIMGRALAPIEQSIGSWRVFLAARDAFGRIKAFFLDIPVDAARISLPEIKGHLSVENVSFKMNGTDKAVLQRISFALEPGTALTLVGPSASGKSTLCRLIVGSWKPTIGNVRLDGADMLAFNPEDMARAVGYMPQNVELFAGTVKDNIARLGVPDDAAVMAAAHEAGCHEAILRLPAGYETELGPRGMFLSGGQRQRIGLARALYGDPKLVVLDEPNSSLDQEGEKALLEAIRRRKAAGATVIIVSHRLSMLQSIDKIALLRDGRLELFGDRDDVLKELAPKSVSAPTGPAETTDQANG